MTHRFVLSRNNVECKMAAVAGKISCRRITVQLLASSPAL
jgi:hypothetical protein